MEYGGSEAERLEISFMVPLPLCRDAFTSTRNQRRDAPLSLHLRYHARYVVPLSARPAGTPDKVLKKIPQVHQQRVREGEHASQVEVAEDFCDLH